MNKNIFNNYLIDVSCRIRVLLLLCCLFVPVPVVVSLSVLPSFLFGIVERSLFIFGCCRLQPLILGTTTMCSILRCIIASWCSYRCV